MAAESVALPAFPRSDLLLRMTGLRMNDIGKEDLEGGLYNQKEDDVNDLLQMRRRIL